MGTLSLVASLLLLCCCFSISASVIPNDLRLPPNARFPRAQAEKLIRELNLFPRDASTYASESRLKDGGKRIVERTLVFPGLAGVADGGVGGVSVEDLGHHAGDTDRLVTAKDEFHAILEEEELKGAVVLVYANKQDLPGALDDAAVTEALELHKIKNRQWAIFKTSAIKGEGLLRVWIG